MNVKTNSTKSSVAKYTEKLRSSIPAQLVLASAVVLLITAFCWHRFIFLGTQSVFDGMLQQSLRTTSYTRTDTSEQQGVTQTTQSQVQFGPETFVRRLTTLSQEIQGQKNSVQREAIGTPTADFERLVVADFPSEPQAAAGYESVKGKWVKAEIQAGTETSQYLLSSLFGILPMASLSSAQQTELTNFLKEENVYSIDKDAGITKSTVDGKEVYVYTVSIKQAAYVAYVQKFAEALGFGDKTNFDPNQYANQPDIKVKLSVRPASRQLVAVEYTENPTRQERYSSYGVRAALVLPKNAVSSSELQNNQKVN